MPFFLLSPELHLAQEIANNQVATSSDPVTVEVTVKGRNKMEGFVFLAVGVTAGAISGYSAYQKLRYSISPYAITLTEEILEARKKI